MENRSPESGLELVLDNRKLIVAFALFITVCGCFFILGFVEGKRQAAQEATRNEQREAKIAVGEQGKKQADDRAAKEQLDWYKSVSDRDAAASKVVSKGAPPAKEAAPSKSVGGEPAAAAPSPAMPSPKQSVTAKTTYSVQVGVFKNRDKVEAVGRSLKAKGYQSYIESVDSGAYSLRVGRFDSRAEAVALSHRLKADGFAALIKAK